MPSIRSLGGRALRSLQRRGLISEASGQEFRRLNERPAEFAFLFRCLCAVAPRKVLDVGTGTTALPALLRNCGCVVTAIDNVSDYWEAGMHNRHWHVGDFDIQAGIPPGGPHDLISCISVLEHVADHRAAMRNMLGALAPGGHLCLCGPYSDREYVEDCYRAPGAHPESLGNPYICRSYSRAELDAWLADSGAELVMSEYWRTWSGRHWSQGERLAIPVPSTPEGPHTHACFLIRKVSPAGSS